MKPKHSNIVVQAVLWVTLFPSICQNNSTFVRIVCKFGSMKTGICMVMKVGRNSFTMECKIFRFRKPLQLKLSCSYFITVDQVLEFEYLVTSDPLPPNLFPNSAPDLFLIVSILPLLVRREVGLLHFQRLLLLVESSPMMDQSGLDRLLFRVEYLAVIS